MVSLHRVLIICLALSAAACRNQSTPDREPVEADRKTDSSSKPVLKNIVFFGNSLTAGYGLDPSQAFPAIIQKKIDSLGLPYQVINAGLSGETTAAGKNRIDWILRNKTDIFFLELGANDGLRGILLSETEANLQSIVDRVRAKYPEARMILAGMEVPPNMGKKYADQFRSIFRKTAEKNKMVLIPFLLEGVGGVPELNQRDGIHPTAEGHKRVAEGVWKALSPLL
jgi:acyl-CoA thioesterase-1